MSDDRKNQALENALSQITKRYGDGSIMRLGDSQSLSVDVISTGSLA
ncbi:MAG: DNA recombination/repair protein RecA, partial [Anaerolineae bacterium]|nr:DNA recombination/repair protein RecA [Anaerolineae bacterium]